MNTADDFGREIDAFVAKVRQRMLLVHEEVTLKLHESITEGSAITGAPGQPVQTGWLKASWKVFRIRTFVSLIITACVYAKGIETGISQRWGTPMKVRSKVGGFHSVKLTRAGFKRLVEDVRKRIVHD